MATDDRHSDEGIRQAASDSVRQGEGVRERVRDLTLDALTSRRFDREAIREMVRVDNRGREPAARRAAAPAARGTPLAEAFRGMDQALAQVGARRARRRCASSSRPGAAISERELQQALAGLQKIEEDFVATVSQVAESAGERVAPRAAGGGRPGDARGHRDRAPGCGRDDRVHADPCRHLAQGHAGGHRARGRVRRALRADRERRAHRDGRRARQVLGRSEEDSS